MSNNKFIFQKNEYGIQGIVRAFLANRTSFFLGLTGPSTNVDSSCCGGATALQEGFMAIKTGRAENALVASSNIILHPETSLQLSLLGIAISQCTQYFCA